MENGLSIRQSCKFAIEGTKKQDLFFKFLLVGVFDDEAPLMRVNATKGTKKMSSQFLRSASSKFTVHLLDMARFNRIRTFSYVSKRIVAVYYRNWLGKCTEEDGSALTQLRIEELVQALPADLATKARGMVPRGENRAKHLAREEGLDPAAAAEAYRADRAQKRAAKEAAENLAPAQQRQPKTPKGPKPPRPKLNSSRRKKRQEGNGEGNGGVFRPIQLNVGEDRGRSDATWEGVSNDDLGAGPLPPTAVPVPNENVFD